MMAWMKDPTVEIVVTLSYRFLSDLGEHEFNMLCDGIWTK